MTGHRSSPNAGRSPRRRPIAPSTGDDHATTRPDGFFEAEAAGIDWLRIDGGAPLPEVISALPDILALEWLDEGSPSAAAARAFGASLARTHRAGAPHFGAAWPGYIGALPLDNTPDVGPWSRWFGERRLLPYLRMSVDRGALGPADTAAVEALVNDIGAYAAEADAEPPARIHGDLWPGNLLWSTGGPVYLIDPAAHGGHRESDLAQLSLVRRRPLPERHHRRLSTRMAAIARMVVSDTTAPVASPPCPYRALRVGLSGCCDGGRTRYRRTMSSGALIDSYGRTAVDLRVSLTDKCNLRCTYCMPAEGLDWLPRADVLTDDEVVRLVRLAVERLGVREVRFTGGEPLLRKGIVDIVAATAASGPGRASR